MFQKGKGFCLCVSIDNPISRSGAEAGGCAVIRDPEQVQFDCMPQVAAPSGEVADVTQFKKN
jgi:hypothetical protein